MGHFEGLFLQLCVFFLEFLGCLLPMGCFISHLRLDGFKLSPPLPILFEHLLHLDKLLFLEADVSLQSIDPSTLCHL